VVRAGQMAAVTPVLLQVCWQKAGKHEIHEIQVTKGLSEDVRVKGEDSWSCRSVKRDTISVEES